MALSYGDQLTFARDFAAYSGMNGNVILAWCLQEQPPGSPATPGSNNWLNIQYTDSGPNSTYYRIAKLSPADAARASVVWMGENQPSITASKGKSAYDQALAIVNSGWASSKYGGIGKFFAVVQQVAGAKLPTTGAAPKTTHYATTTTAAKDPPTHHVKVRASGNSLSQHGTRQLQWAHWVASVRKRKLYTPTVERPRNVRA